MTVSPILIPIVFIVGVVIGFVCTVADGEKE